MSEPEPVDDGPDLTAHITTRTRWYRSLDDGARLAVSELYTFLNDTIVNNRTQKNSVTGEANQFERQFAGFFAVAISFIVGGLLTAIPPKSATQADKVFFISALFCALLAAAFLLVESIFIQRFFGRWQLNNDEIGEYISKGSWHGPSELNEWIASKEKQLPKKSPRWISYVMLGLVALAIIFLACWQIEVLFNPNWPVINPIR
jgi:MFS family permease